MVCYNILPRYLVYFVITYIMHGAIDKKVQSYPSKFIQQTHLLASY